MSKEKFRLENRLGTSGVVVTVVLIITTIITGLLFIASGFIKYVLHNSDRINGFLETFGIENADIHQTFDINSSLSWLGSTPIFILIIAVILFLLVIWVSLYKLNSVYTYRAFRGYGVSLICVSGLVILLGLIADPIMSRFAENYYSGYENAFTVGKWLIILSSLPVFALGLLMLLISLFAAFPAKTDMRRPRKNGEKDVSFIMDDDDAKQSYEYSVSDKTFVPSNDVQTAKAEIVENTCPNCGAAAREGAVFCIECGNKL